MSSDSEPSRLLLVDDSPIVAGIFEIAIAGHPLIELVGVASDGAQALPMVRSLKPDVVCMDLHMPGINGLKAVEQIMADHPCPIVVITGSQGVDLAHNRAAALLRGAVEFRIKPRGDEELRQLLDYLHLLSGVPVIYRRRPQVRSRSGDERIEPIQKVGPVPHRLAVVGIGASTGGPEALRETLVGIPATVPAAFVVVQHIAPGYTEEFAAWLDGLLSLQVVVARAASELKAGNVYVAPEDHHLRVDAFDRIMLDSHSAKCDGHRPSCTVLLESLAGRHGPTTGVVLTGMGRDGTKGLMAMREQGHPTLVQDAFTSRLDGMTRSARESGAASTVLPLDEMSTFLMKWFGSLGA